MQTRDKADPYPNEASRAADLAAQTAGIIAAREARTQQEAQRELAKTRAESHYLRQKPNWTM